jgi:NAD(P)H-dependent flavin oxidoreductase YrpB (nitropropane dioxygenase family)
VIHTPVCDLLRIRHPIALGGMAGHTSVPLVTAVSKVGGLGTLGVGRTPVEQIPKDIEAIRETAKRPFGVNFLLFDAREPAIDAALKERPPVFAAAWALGRIRTSRRSSAAPMRRAAWSCTWPARYRGLYAPRRPERT